MCTLHEKTLRTAPLRFSLVYYSPPPPEYSILVKSFFSFHYPFTETMFRFQTDRYGSIFARLIDGAPPTAISTGTPHHEALAELEPLTVEAAFTGKPIQNQQAAEGCISGIWLLHHFLDRSHTISQDISSSTGSFWHGIMHRREPDYSNAAYWFRKVGNHEVFLNLASPESPFYSEAVEGGLIVDGQWDPFRFIDLCAEVTANSTAQIDLCRKITRIEWELLFDYGYRQATESDA